MLVVKSLDKKKKRKKSQFLLHTKYTDRLDSKRNPNFILMISTPTSEVVVASPRCFVSAAGAPHEFNENFFFIL